MKITLEFDTEKDEDYTLHKTYIKAEDMNLAMNILEVITLIIQMKIKI